MMSSSVLFRYPSRLELYSRCPKIYSAPAGARCLQCLFLFTGFRVQRYSLSASLRDPYLNYGFIFFRPMALSFFCFRKRPRFTGYPLRQCRLLHCLARVPVIFASLYACDLSWAPHCVL